MLFLIVITVLVLIIILVQPYQYVYNLIINCKYLNVRLVHILFYREFI